MTFQSGASIDYLETAFQPREQSTAHRAYVIGRAGEVPMTALSSVETRTATNTGSIRHIRDVHAGKLGVLPYHVRRVDDTRILINLVDEARDVTEVSFQTHGILSMLLGNDVEVIGSQWSEGLSNRIRLHGLRDRARGVGLPAMIPFAAKAADDFWLFFESAMQFARVNSDRASHLIKNCHDLRAADRASLRVACLVAATVVESLIDDPQFQANGMDRSIPPDDLARMQVEIRKLSAAPEHIERLVGLSGMLANVPTRQRLKAWARGSELHSGFVKSWNAIRNSAAHGEPVNFDQVTVNGYYHLVFLVYHLVAEIVGYSGPLVGHENVSTK
jgi:hypothetical protein